LPMREVFSIFMAIPMSHLTKAMLCIIRFSFLIPFSFCSVIIDEKLAVILSSEGGDLDD